MTVIKENCHLAHKRTHQFIGNLTQLLKYWNIPIPNLTRESIQFIFTVDSKDVIEAH